MKVNIVGAGLAGSEAAYQLAIRGHSVRLYEMRPGKNTPAHHTDGFAELVCSNSLRSNQLENAVGLLKQELRMMGSLVMKVADETAVPAGGALAVDRESFSRKITNVLQNHNNIEIIREEFTDIDTEDYTIIATGPLTSEILAERIMRLTESEHLYFYDAAAPIINLNSIDRSIVFRASRYDKGEDDYLNCPMNREEYESFWRELVNAERAERKSFEKEIVFEGCMPVEKMAERGIDTLLYGSLKPVGLTDPRTGKWPYAVVQLRQDNSEGTLFNIVGFQTHLKWGEQKRVFGLIPGLKNAEFERYGVMHRNTYINSPKLLSPTLQMLKHPKILFAGQITGVEGYIESTSMGMLAGINLARIADENGQGGLVFPRETAIGALAAYISDPFQTNFQPMNVNFGLLPSLNQRIRDKRQKNRLIAERSIGILNNYILSNHLAVESCE